MSGGDLVARLSGRRGAVMLDAAFQAPAGSVTALVGVSGAGKSTLLRAVAGLERLAGEVRVGERAWQGAGRFLPPHRRAVGLVFQHAALLAHLSVRGNLDYGRRRAGVDDTAFDRTVALLGLEPLLQRSPARLSGGERQRVALARALLRAPQVLLLDEPLTGLDAPAKAELLPRLREVLQGLAIPVLYVSHDASEVAAVGARALRLEHGRIAAPAAGPPDPLAGIAAERVRALARTALRAGLAPDGEA